MEQRQDEFRLSLKVYIEDTDAGGIVYYVNYLKFMERARTDYMLSLGFGKRDIFEQEHMFVVHRVEVDYHQPAKLDDVLQVSAKPVVIGRAYIDFQQRVYRGDEVLCEGVVRAVCIKREGMKPAPIPKAIFNTLPKLK